MPQYLCRPLSQQPVFMHADWRRPQLVRQFDTDARSRLLLQVAMQVFCSPLHRIGAELAGEATKMAKGANAIEIASVADKRAWRESISGLMGMS
jgi:hypothetical protein